MKFLNKLERKFGRYAIHNLAAYIIGMYVIGYVFYFFMPDIFQWLTLEPYYILRGQIWRLVTWLLIPPESPGIFTIIMLFFYYSLGISLERAWGAFRFNVYILLGMISTVLGAFLLYAILGGGGLFGNAFFSTYYINMSIFLAFAMSYPNERVYLYFFIPVKMKWMAIIDVVLILVDVVRYARMGAWMWALMPLASFVNYFIFTWPFWASKLGLARARHNPKVVNFKKAQKKQAKAAQNTPYRHKCAVCGITDLDDPNMEFRYCSKCDGYYCYCSRHINNHVHIHHD